MKRFLSILFVFAALAAASCATTQAKAKSPVDHPPLDMPPVPPRLIEPVPAPPPPPEPVPDLPAATTTSKPRPPSQREQKPADPPKSETPIVETPPAVAPATPPVPPLRTTATPDEAAARQARDMIDRAQASLNAVIFKRLNRQQVAQYNNAKLFINQAEEALKASNYEFAKNLADKADKIAKELAGK